MPHDDCTMEDTGRCESWPDHVYRCPEDGCAGHGAVDAYCSPWGA